MIGIFDNVVKWFGKVTALDGVSFVIDKGITGFIGPNGAGKTTTMSIMTGLIRYDSGEASLFGFDVWRESLEVRRRLGVVLDDIYPYFGLSGWDYLYRLSRLYGYKTSYRDVLRLAEILEIERDLGRPLSTYSAGMLKKICVLGGFLNPDAELVIMDEPMANLDVAIRLKLLSLIKRLHKETNVSLFISSHIIPDLEDVCHRFIIINRGKIVFQGTINELYERISIESYIVHSSDDEKLREILDQYGVEHHVDSVGRLIIQSRDVVEAIKKIIPSLEEAGIKIFSITPVESPITKFFREVINSETS